MGVGSMYNVKPNMRLKFVSCLIILKLNFLDPRFKNIAPKAPNVVDTATTINAIN